MDKFTIYVNMWNVQRISLQPVNWVVADGVPSETIMARFRPFTNHLQYNPDAAGNSAD